MDLRFHAAFAMSLCYILGYAAYILERIHGEPEEGEIDWCFWAITCSFVAGIIATLLPLVSNELELLGLALRGDFNAYVARMEQRMRILSALVENNN